jgi:hypothetical protein
LVIEDGTRHLSYCLLLLSRVDIEEDALREQAGKYGLEDEIDALLSYLDSNGEVNAVHLPTWDEFQELAADYDVTLPD